MRKQMSPLRLTIELVPVGQWFDNVRKAVTRATWDRLRRRAYEDANHVCEICGGRGHRHPVECHEVWQYDDTNRVQKLIRLIALCPRCHEVKHMGLAVERGTEMRALEHFARVNDLDAVRACDEVEAAFELVHQRSAGRPWKLDLTFLKSLV